MMRLPIARDAAPFLGGFAAAAILSFVYFSVWLAALWMALFLMVAFFFRDPERRHSGVEGIVLAPADGRVVRVREGPDGSTLSIFLSLLDVHVNRSPVSGQVARVEHRRGRFQAAFRHGASSENERNEITIRSSLGEITAIQIAGLLARRIVCTLREGDHVEAGQRIGLIRFGSRMDVVVPPTVQWTVGVGSHVRAGVTVIGRGPEP